MLTSRIETQFTLSIHYIPINCSMKIFHLRNHLWKQDIDSAMLRRIEKRVLIDLPTLKERQELFQYFLPSNMESKGCGLHLSCKINYSDLAQVSEGYSGSDIKLVCKEALMEKMRDVFKILENYEK
ncbi:hypothetical protein J437_LFUL009421, partial [Ladona fulva]